MSEFKQLSFNSESELVELLLKYPSINTELWVKSVSSLYKEIVDNDCVIGIENEKLHRRVDVVKVKCFYTNDQGEKFQLIELKQVFKNGHIRERGHKYVAEKLQFGEIPEQGALRGLKEELQLKSEDIKIISLPDENTFEKSISQSYKGLECSYNMYVFRTEIPEVDYKEMYIEDQPDKQTFFTWIKV